MSGAFKVSIIAVFLFMFSACSDIKDELEIFKDDVDLDVNDRTLDITKENAQPIVYGFIQSSLRSFLYLPLFNFLDSSDLPDTALLVDDEYIYDCSLGGRAFYSLARPDGEEYRAGDQFAVRYEACEETDGVTFDGSISLTYSEIDGLNESFSLNSSERCEANLGKTFDGSYSVYENRDDSGELFWADDVRFALVGNGLEIQYLKRSESAPFDNEVVFTKEAFGNSIVVLRALEEDESRSGEAQIRYKIKENSYPSLKGVDGLDLLEVIYDLDEVNGGDEFYRLAGRTSSQVECQSYERYANLRASNLISTVADDVTFVMNGTTKIYQSSDRLLQFSERVYDSNFKVGVLQGNDERIYSFGETYSAAKGVDTTRSPYSYSVTGGMTFDGGGYAELEELSTVFSSGLSTPPSSGGFVILGKDLEAISINFDSETVSLAIDYNGDSTGDGLSDADATFDSYWYDILDQNFRIID